MISLSLVIIVWCAVFALLLLGAKCRRLVFRKKIYRNFADETDIEQMGLFGGRFLSLGFFGNKALRLNKFFSVLLLGKIGSGKTSSVLIPSILESDGLSILAADEKGTLVKHTQGYRAKLGKTYVLDFDLLDKEDAKFACFNPLSPDNLPKDKEQRKIYVKTLVKTLFGNRVFAEEEYWQKLAQNTLEGLIWLFIERIEQATANDYFLGKIIGGKSLTPKDKEILRSYYKQMPKKYTKQILHDLATQKELDAEAYMPIGSWGNVAEKWRGREASLPLIFDSIWDKYFINESLKNSAIWKLLLMRSLEEAELFAYSSKVKNLLNPLFSFTQKQVDLIFSILYQVLSIFKNQALRERTACTDFCWQQMFGQTNDKTKKKEVTTVYCVMKSRSAKIMSRVFLNLAMIRNLTDSYEQEPIFPLLYVLDDLSTLGCLDVLMEGLVHGYNQKMMFMVVLRDLKQAYKTYGKEALESIVNNASVKLVLGDKHQEIVEHLNDLAVFGTKSIQLQAPDTIKFVKTKEGIADSHYYNKIAKYFNKLLRKKLIEDNDFLFLSPQHYHLPIIAKAKGFLNDTRLKRKSLEEMCLTVDENILEDRSESNFSVPLFDLSESDKALQNAAEKSPQGIKPEADEVDEWWLKEDGFEVKNIENNPFNRKEV